MCFLLIKGLHFIFSIVFLFIRKLCLYRDGMVIIPLHTVTHALSYAC